MSGLYDYSIATQLHGVPFDALVMAAMLRADTHNLNLLARAFPALAGEVRARYEAPGGALPTAPTS